jgi:hypothetical protein
MAFNVLSRCLNRQPLSRVLLSRRRGSCRPGVEPLEDRQLLSTYVVMTADDNGNNASPTPGSLRQAIVKSNMNPGSNLILFQIPNVAGQSDVHTIKPPTPLPPTTVPVTISAALQVGAVSNQDATDDNAQHKIVLDGSLLTSGNGLTIIAGNSVVDELVIDNFPGWGISLAGVGSDTVTGNFIGTDVTGKVAAGNGLGGISVDSSAPGNIIGDGMVADRNLISGNVNGPGIHLGSSDNRVQNNFVGADAGGMADLPNFQGIDVVGGSSNFIGGQASAAEDNLIAGNLQDGLVFEQNASANNVGGNHITLNQGNGIAVQTGSRFNVIGNLFSGPVNDVSFNDLAGVRIYSGTGNALTSFNSIAGNGGRGIDEGVNKQQVAPVLTSVAVAGGQTTVTGMLTTTPTITLVILFFGNPSTSPAQGKTFLGSIQVKTDGSGNATFSAPFSTALAPGDTVTATATDLASTTSEFSAPLAVPLPPPPAPTPTPTPMPLQDVTPQVSVQRGKLRRRGGRSQQMIALRNNGPALGGLLYLVLSGLPRKVQLQQSGGVTRHLAPLGNPYVVVDLGGQLLGTGQSRTVVLTFSNPFGRKVRYNLSVLAGIGAP